MRLLESFKFWHALYLHRLYSYYLWIFKNNWLCLLCVWPNHIQKRFSAFNLNCIVWINSDRMTYLLLSGGDTSTHSISHPIHLIVYTHTCKATSVDKNRLQYFKVSSTDSVGWMVGHTFRFSDQLPLYNLKEWSWRLVTFVAFDQSDAETWPVQKLHTYQHTYPPTYLPTSLREPV